VFIWIKKYKYIDEKDKDFIIFVIDMYIEYAKELNIHSVEHHERVIKRLEKIKEKYFYEKKKKND